MEQKDIYNIVGKLAYKKRGFFEGIVGKVELNSEGHSVYVLVYPSGSLNCFNKLNEIEIFEVQA